MVSTLDISPLIYRPVKPPPPPPLPISPEQYKSLSGGQWSNTVYVHREKLNSVSYQNTCQTEVSACISVSRLLPIIETVCVFNEHFTVNCENEYQNNRTLYNNQDKLLVEVKVIFAVVK